VQMHGPELVTAAVAPLWPTAADPPGTCEALEVIVVQMHGFELVTGAALVGEEAPGVELPYAPAMKARTCDGSTQRHGNELRRTCAAW